MRKTVPFILAASMLLIGPAVVAQNKPADQAGATSSNSGRRFDNLSAEEQAKLRQQWQTTSTSSQAAPSQAGGASTQTQATPPKPVVTAPPRIPATDVKPPVADKTRERTTSRGLQMRKDAIVAEITRLQAQHKANVDELQTIRQIALKENAKETVSALTGLIAKHEARLNQQVQGLQQRLKLLQGEQPGKVGIDPPTQPAKPVEKPATTEPKVQSPADKPK